MKNTRRWLGGVALVAFALLSLACGSVRQAAQRQQNANDLKQIGLGYINYCSANGKGPAKAEDLMPYLENNALLLQKMKSGEYSIIWGANITDMKQFTKTSTSQTVLGNEATAPTSGGQVLMCDGSVRMMTAAEFNSAIKVQPGAAAPK